jgi:hypothetical protein
MKTNNTFVEDKGYIEFFNSLKEVCKIGHSTDKSVYGALYNINGNMYFERHRWTNVNQSQKAPKVYGQVKLTVKKVGNDIFNSFVELSNSEYLERDVLDMQNLK